MSLLSLAIVVVIAHALTSVCAHDCRISVLSSSPNTLLRNRSVASQRRALKALKEQVSKLENKNAETQRTSAERIKALQQKAKELQEIRTALDEVKDYGILHSHVVNVEIGVLTINCWCVPVCSKWQRAIRCCLKPGTTP